MAVGSAGHIARSHVKKSSGTATFIKVFQRLGEGHGKPKDASSIGPVVFRRLGGGLSPVVDVFHLR